MSEGNPMAHRSTERKLPSILAEDVKRLTEDEAKSLVAIVENGPLDTAELHSLPSAIKLAKAGWVVDVLVHGEIGFMAATREGLLAYCRLLNVDSVAEGRLKRHESHSVQKS